MALDIERTLENGTVVNHHRIVRVLSDWNAGEIKLEVASYVTKEIRDAEKQNMVDYARAEDIRARLDALTREPTDENQNERQTLSDELNALFEAGKALTTPRLLSIITTEYSLQATDDKSRADLYEYLKTLPEFKGAKKS